MNPGGAYLSYYLNDIAKSQDAHGVSLFNIRGLTFYGFSSEPAMPSKNVPFDLTIYTDYTNLQQLTCWADTVSAYEYLDENGIEHIVSFQTGANLLQLAMEPVAGTANCWHLQTPIKIGTAGKLIGLKFVAKSQVDSVASEVYAVRIKREPDLTPVNIRQGGTTFPELLIDVAYTGDDTLPALVRIEKIGLTGSTLFKELEHRFLPSRVNQVRVKGILGRDWIQFKVTVDPYNVVTESSETNNVLLDSIYIENFPLLPGVGTSYDGVTNDTLAWGFKFKLYIPPNQVTDSAVVSLGIDTQTRVLRQPAFNLIPPDPNQAIYNCTVSLRSNKPTTQPAIVEIDLSQLNSSDWHSLRLGKWYSNLQIWLCDSTQINNTRLIGYTTIPGTFGIIRSSDVTPPQIELNLEGQTFFQNSYVSDKPSISIIGEDDNGVRFDEQGLQVWLDNQRIDFSQLGIADTVQDGRFISAQFRPSLSPGLHTLKVILADATGNRATKMLNFTVSDELKLVDYGNYPNPFKDRTVFIYDLTQRVGSFKIKIYTVSGRLIRVLEESNVYSSGASMNEGGYHEVIWDGRDQDGNFVANGVYFYKMIARKGNKTVSSIGKIAKAR